LIWLYNNILLVDRLCGLIKSDVFFESNCILFECGLKDAYKIVMRIVLLGTRE
jgi:hypothetical protein